MTQAERDMSRNIDIEPIAVEKFAQFGDLLDIAGKPDMMINGGMCGRFHDLARLEFTKGGRAGMSIFQAESHKLPLTLRMVERHPLGSQAFLPTTQDPFLVVVAPDEHGRPGRPQAFITAPGQGVNYHRGVWHGVLTPLVPARFFVLDRIGDGNNLEEYSFEEPYVVRAIGR